MISYYLSSTSQTPPSNFVSNRVAAKWPGLHGGHGKFHPSNAWQCGDVSLNTMVNAHRKDSGEGANLFLVG